MTGPQAPTFASLRRATPQDRARAMASGREWFRITNRQSGGTTYAEVYIYDEIGYYGVTAGQFVAELGDLDVDEIDLHLNSPGGEVWDGIAIYNALVSHRAKVTAICEGIAASAASVVFMAGDERVMAQGAQLMIHDAWGVCVGNSADMESMRDRLDAESNNIAGFYASRSGGTVAAWRKAMLAETWYSADEAVAAGLAERVEKAERPTPDASQNRWDLSVFGFRYKGRDEAPAPAAPEGSAPAPAAPAPIVRPPVAAGPAPAPAPPAPDPALEPDDDAADALVLAAALGSVLASAVTDAATDDEPVITAEMIRDAVDYEANHRPAVNPGPPVDLGPSAAELAAANLISNSIMEALS